MSVIVSLHSRLPRISDEEAQARNRLLAALDGLSLEGLTLQARVIGPAEQGAALIFDTNDGAIGLTPERLAGQPANPLLATSPTLPETLTQISRLEPLIGTVEKACGHALDPTRISDEALSGLHVRLDALGPEGEVVHRARLVIPEVLAAAFQPQRGRGLGLAGRALAARRLILRGPLVPHGELADIQEGDMVVLPAPHNGRLLAWLDNTETLYRGGFAPAAGHFQIDREDAHMLDAEPSEDTTMSDPVGPPRNDAERLSALPVRLNVALPAMEVAVSDLASLAPGAVLRLPLPEGDLKVELTTGGVTIGSGRLVALGSAYGVLVDRLAER